MLHREWTCCCSFARSDEWSLAAVFIFATPGYRSLAGPLKGGDFIQFYAMGAVAKATADGRLYDVDRLHAVPLHNFSY